MLKENSVLIVAPVGIVVVKGFVTWKCLHKQFTSNSKLNFSGIRIQLITFASFVFINFEYSDST